VVSRTHGCAWLGRTRTRAAIATAAALVAAAALAAPASAQLVAAGPVDPDTGFPESYTDAAGQTVDLCVDAEECGDATVPNAPDGEAFFWSAESADIPLSGGGTVAAIYAVEAAFGGDTDQSRIVFSRMRYRFEDAAAGTYAIQTPWGPQTVTTSGNQSNAGEDVGCDPVGTQDCDFGLALDTTISTFLHSEADATDRLLGPGPGTDDAEIDVVPGPVLGSPTGFNRVSVSGPGGTGSTGDFIVTGRLAGDADPVAIMSATPSGFGPRTIGTAAIQNVTVRNDGLPDAPDLEVGTPTITGAADFSIASNACPATLAVDESCTIGVRFAPTATGARTATLNLPSNALVGNGAALGGTGVTAGTPVTPATAGNATPATITNVVVVRAPQSTVQGRQVRALAVSNLALARRISISRLRSQGLRLSMTVPSDSRVVRVSVYRARGGRKSGPALATVFRTASQAGLLRVTLRDRALLRRLRPGLYVIEVRPGTSRTALGATARSIFRVTR
jgi:hypothetical protein